LTNACASLAASCLNRSVVLSVDSLGTGAILTVNLTDDFLVLSAHVNSRFINTAICVPPIGFTSVVEQVRPGRRVHPPHSKQCGGSGRIKKPPIEARFAVYSPSSRSSLTSRALWAASACHSIAISAHADLKSLFGTSRPSFSHAKALRRYFSEIFIVVVPLEAGAQHSLSPVTALNVAVISNQSFRL
jgi:hypothetical protein